MDLAEFTAELVVGRKKLSKTISPNCSAQSATKTALSDVKNALSQLICTNLSSNKLLFILVQKVVHVLLRTDDLHTSYKTICKDIQDTSRSYDKNGVK